MISEYGAMGALGVGVLGAAGVGEADVDAAPILRTQRPGNETVALQSADNPGKRALRQMHGVGQFLHPMTVVFRLGEPVEHLEIAHPEPVGVQLPLERAEHRRMLRGKIAPLGNQVLVSCGYGHGRQVTTFPRIKCNCI